MRINAYVARATGLSRRAADQAISAGRVFVNDQPAAVGQSVDPAADKITLDAKTLKQRAGSTILLLNKPPGYVCSRAGQGSRTIYDLLPAEYHRLKPVGRLDKDSSGLLLLTDDGALANRLTHPSYGKQKVYEAELDKPLSQNDARQLEKGVRLNDGPSRLRIKDYRGQACTVALGEGRNRQIRRTFAALGYSVTRLHRTHFGDYRLGNLLSARYRNLD